MDDVYMSDGEDSGVDSSEIDIKDLSIPPCHKEAIQLIESVKPEDVDPRVYFPAFKPNGILRFSRMLEVDPEAARQNTIWWTSKTFYKKSGQQSDQEELQLNISPNFSKDQCVTDQAELLMKSEEEFDEWKSLQSGEEYAPPSWRFGPAQIWYDRLKVPKNVKDFDYGFNLVNTSEPAKETLITHIPSNEELLPVNLIHWENDIIMDDSEIDCQDYKTSKNFSTETMQVKAAIFPAENYDLEYTRWEDNIILDSENMPSIPKPQILTIDYQDDPTIFGTLEDIDEKDEQVTKKSKMILGQVQRRQKQEEDMEQECQSTEKDAFNLSNDEYYVPKTVSRAIGAEIRHSIPAQSLHWSLYPTYTDVQSNRNLHRLPPSEKIMGRLINREVQIQSAHKFVMEAEKCQKLKIMMGPDGIRSLNDLSARDGTLICIEYSEEYPPLLSQPGMSSKIRNYHPRGQKEVEGQFEFGETAFTLKLPFLSDLPNGQSIQSIENNMYKAPIFQHETPFTDFILIRSANGFFIRECPNVFVAGQECPIYEVPSPSSKKTTEFKRDCLVAFIYRLFWESEHQPKRLNAKDIKEAFPTCTDSSIKTLLNQCAEYVRTPGNEQNYWALKKNFRLPTKEAVLNMLTPEMYCANYSMQAAEQRLKDAGYGDKHLLTIGEVPDDRIENEVKCAPWNTTRSFISAFNGKSLLDKSGIADPTGNGQALSYVTVAENSKKDKGPKLPRRLVSGTDADLRKIPLEKAKNICRSYGVRDEEVNALTRWEIIGLIRTLSTQAVEGKTDFGGVAKFARTKLNSNVSEAQSSFNKHCQRIFNLQSRVLSSTDQLDTDDESDHEDNLKQFDVETKADEFEDEEKERIELLKMVHGEGFATEKLAKDEVRPEVIRKLCIHRIVKDEEGNELERLEVISNPQVVNAYSKIRESKDGDFIKIYSEMDDEFKEERREEKRRLQNQRNKLKSQGQKKKKADAPKKTTANTQVKSKCSACGQIGHMKSNKKCPLYDQYKANKEAKASDKS